MPDRYVLVLAGGRGERFWPWSRPERPKQLLPLARDGRTLLAATLDRARALVPAERIVVLTANDLKEAVRGECADSAVHVLSEPMGRNTAPAIGLAAALFRSWGVDPSFAVLPADHAIEDTEAFARDLEASFGIAERDPFLVTLGIPPTGPETRFGYIHRGRRLGDRFYRVDRFTEKPDRDRAVAWVASGEYAWNSGIFVWRCSTFQLALEASRPDLGGPLGTLKWTGSEEEFERQLAEIFPRLESISVDYAVLEHAPNVVMIEASFDWDDLGSWSAWARHQPHDARGNVLFGDAYALDCERCVVVGDGGVAAAIGVDGMVIVHTHGATLACRLEDSDDVRRISAALKSKGGS